MGVCIQWDGRPLSKKPTTTPAALKALVCTLRPEILHTRRPWGELLIWPYYRVRRDWRRVSTESFSQDLCQSGVGKIAGLLTWGVGDRENMQVAWAPDGTTSARSQEACGPSCSLSTVPFPPWVLSLRLIQIHSAVTKGPAWSRSSSPTLMSHLNAKLYLPGHYFKAGVGECLKESNMIDD